MPNKCWICAYLTRVHVCSIYTQHTCSALHISVKDILRKINIHLFKFPKNPGSYNATLTHFRFHNQYQSDMAAMAEEREEIELSFPSVCLPDPDPNDPFVDYHPPKTIISSKNGYLFLRG